MKQTALDLLCTGCAGVDLYGEQVGGRLEDMGSFAKYVGGSPAMRLCLACCGAGYGEKTGRRAVLVLTPAQSRPSNYKRFLKE